MEKFIMPEQQFPKEPLTEEQKKEVQAKIEAEQARQQEEMKEILKKKRPLAAAQEEKIGQKELAEEIKNTL